MIMKLIRGKDNIMNFISNNTEYILNIEEETNEIYRVKLMKHLNKHFNMSHIGCSILSNARKIMNEIYNMSEDNDIKIYYTDTDSIFLKNDDVNKLENIYKNKTGKNLIGRELGQFKHELPEAGRGVFVQKKKYCVAFPNNAPRIRCAGLSSNTIINFCENNNINVVDLYKSAAGNVKINIPQGVKYQCAGIGIIKTEFNFNF